MRTTGETVWGKDSKKKRILMEGGTVWALPKNKQGETKPAVPEVATTKRCPYCHLMVIDLEYADHLENHLKKIQSEKIKAGQKKKSKTKKKGSKNGNKNTARQDETSVSA